MRCDCLSFLKKRIDSWSISLKNALAGTCVQSCPKGNLSVGAVGAVTRGLLDADFLEMKEGKDCLVCGICARVSPQVLLS